MVSTKNDPDKIELSLLEVTLLRSLKNTQDEKELSRMTNVDRKVIEKTLDDLFEADYVGRDSMVTEKGFELLNRPNVAVKVEPAVELTSLELLLLKSVDQSMDDKKLSRLTKVDLATVSEKLDKLYDEDLITNDLMLTKKGFNLLNQPTKEPGKEAARPSAPRGDEGSRRTSPTPSVVVIQREIVKVPCKYCGMLVDPVRDAKCPSCGANLVMPRS